MTEVFQDSNQVATAASVLPGVLLAVADPLSRKRFAELLAAAEWQVHAVASAEDALATLEDDASVVILDEALAEGEMFCRTLRAQTFAPRLYLILLVADLDAAMAGDSPAAAWGEPDDYLDRRATAAELSARLRMAQRILGLRRSLCELTAEQARLVTVDALTGANNRAYFMRHLYRDLEQVRRFGGMLSILVIDVDHFKRINDRYGHTAGDEVLRELSRRVGASLRDCDWHARVGDEEFAVVLPQTSSPGARVLAERLRRQISVAPVQTSAGAVAVSLSIGIGALEAFGSAEAVTVERLFGLACRCVHQSKARGRDCVAAPEDLAARGGTRKY